MVDLSESYGITALRMDDILHLKGVRVGAVIGVGAFGSVHFVRHMEKEYAAKKMNETLLGEAFSLRNMKDFCRKCSPIFKMSEIGKANIVEYVGIYQEDPNSLPLLVMEQLNFDLRYALHIYKNTLTFRDEVNICHDIASGLHFLHSQVPEIHHGNLHAGNILINVPLKAKITDLMNTRLLSNPEDILKKEIASVPGHTEYLPPEVFQNVNLYDSFGDMFSFGVLGLEVVTRRAPLPPKSFRGSEVLRRKDDLDRIPDTHAMKNLILGCLKDHSTDRPSAQEACVTIHGFKKTLDYGVSPSAAPGMDSFSQLLLSKRYKLCWQKVSTMPSGMSGAVAVVDRDGMVYVAGGWTDTAANLTSVIVYTPKKDYWTTTMSPVEYGSPVLLDGITLTLVGGIYSLDSKITNKVFSLTEGEWSNILPPMTTARLNPAVGIHDNKVLIAAGGLGHHGYLDTIEFLDLDEDLQQWKMSSVTLRHPLGDATCSLAAGTMTILGNYTDENGSKIQEVLSVSVATILTSTAPVVAMQTLPPPPYVHCTIVPNSVPPLVVGGCFQGDVLPGIYSYNSTQWQQVGVMTSSRAFPAAVVLHNFAILILGGVTDPDNLCKQTCIKSVETGYLEEL